MNKEHYRLEALKLAVELAVKMSLEGHGTSTTEVANLYYEWIMQDAIKEEQAKQAENDRPYQYKIPPNNAI